MQSSKQYWSKKELEFSYKSHTKYIFIVKLRTV